MVAVLRDLQQKEQAYAEHDGERFLDAAQNALLVTNAEQYYRIMYYGSRAIAGTCATGTCSRRWMNLLKHHGPESRGVVWAHNSHVGNAGATEMSKRGEHNIGQLCREAVRRWRVFDRLRHPQRHRRRRHGLGRSDADQERAPVARAAATSGCSTMSGEPKFLLPLQQARFGGGARGAVAVRGSSARSA